LLNTAFAPWPSFTDEEADAVSRVLKSNKVNYWTGDECDTFEREYAEWAGVKHAVSMANGTVALDVAWPALGIGGGDEVITTPRSFFASASTIAMAGARPIFADVDRDSQNISPKTVAPLINKNTKAIVCVHLAGWPVDMDGMRDLAEAHNLKLVEDCAQAHGAAIRGKSVGSFGDLNAWSFCQDKIVTTGGEGGMVTLDDDDLWKSVWAAKDHGKAYDKANKKDRKPGRPKLHDGWGTNWRMTEMQAAIGRIQLKRMPDMHAARKKYAERLTAAFETLPGLRVPEVPADFEHAWYKYYVFARPDALKSGWDRDRILGEVKAAGVPCGEGCSPEIYLEPAFVDSGLAPAQRLPNAIELGETSMMFMVHPTLTEDQIGKTIDTVKKVMAEATR
jgi:dTDP-4-amino-4,6-dideoxygalactose transaminase